MSYFSNFKVMRLVLEDSILSIFSSKRLVISFILDFLAGCSNNSQPKGLRLPVHPVRGKITYKGKPMNGAMITFNREGATKTTIMPSGLSDSEGNYTLTSYIVSDGAPSGKYNVTVYWPESRKTLASPNTEEEMYPMPADRLKGRYNDPSNTKLHATVTKNVQSEKDNVFDFDMTDSSETKK
jgi:hypothetical protein